METLNKIKTAQIKIHELIDQVNNTDEPLAIEGENGTAVIISLEHWEAIQETLYLSNIPGYLEDLRQVAASPREEWVNARDLGLL